MEEQSETIVDNMTEVAEAVEVKQGPRISLRDAMAMAKDKQEVDVIMAKAASFKGASRNTIRKLENLAKVKLASFEATL